jgi:hypothetical protein
MIVRRAESSVELTAYELASTHRYQLSGEVVVKHPVVVCSSPLNIKASKVLGGDLFLVALDEIVAPGLSRHFTTDIDYPHAKLVVIWRESFLCEPANTLEKPFLPVLSIECSILGGNARVVEFGLFRVVRGLFGAMLRGKRVNLIEELFLHL